jgi:hypothetical protein
MDMTNMTPPQKLRAHILAWAHDLAGFTMPALTAETLDAEWQDFDGNDPDVLYEAQLDVRGGQVETGLPCEFSRHYESKAVAAQMHDGSWIGWTYWYGGGKHGEPEAVDWIDYAYALTVTEEVKTITVQNFKKT